MRTAAALALVALTGCLESPPGGVPEVIADSGVGPDGAPCPADAVCILDDGSGHTYAAYEEKVSWEQAVDRCAEIGWYLAIDRSELESVLIQGLLAEPAWIGASDVAVEGDWRWVDGEPWDYTHWRTGEPNGSADENCLTADWGAEAWNDLECDATFPYVCEIGSPAN